VHRAAVEQHRRAVVGVQVREQGDRRVEVGERLVEPTAPQRDQPTQLVDEGVEVPLVAGGGRFRGGTRRRRPSLQTVDLELGEGVRDEQPGSRVQPFRTRARLLAEQREATLDELRTPDRVPGGVRGLRVATELVDPGQQVITWWRGPSRCARPVRTWARPSRLVPG
jgi:hypothetical protein